MKCDCGTIFDEDEHKYDGYDTITQCPNCKELLVIWKK
jgi:hypothetical protein